MAFPLNHFYVAMCATGSPDPVLLIGSILPDASYFCHGLNKQVHQFHEEGSDLIDRYLDEHQITGWRMLPIGMRLHSVKSRGLDWYSDTTNLEKSPKEYDGFMFQHCRPLTKHIMGYLKINEDRALILAHNFVETAVSLNIAKRFPKSVIEMDRVLSVTDTRGLSQLIASIFDLLQTEIYTGLRLMFETFSLDNQLDIYGYTRIWITLGNLLIQKTLTEDIIRNLILMASDIIEDTWQEFVNISVDSISKTYREALISKNLSK